ncbi:hypothetical protein [Streptococcus sp. X13SY08]|uniref:hypothetical protein n=1 Tax=Streptococcus sp. X13SY08 TaxID=1676616 RepID=UPI001364B066|nr:hypothetical protein [Streptococcus sp. X13SY08]
MSQLESENMFDFYEKHKPVSLGTLFLDLVFVPTTFQANWMAAAATGLATLVLGGYL